MLLAHSPTLGLPLCLFLTSLQWTCSTQQYTPPQTKWKKNFSGLLVQGLCYITRHNLNSTHASQTMTSVPSGTDFLDEPVHP